MGQRCSPLWRRCSAIYRISSVPSSLGMFIWALLYSKCQLSEELVVKENSLWRLFFLITHQQIRSSSWGDRRQCDVCSAEELAQKETKKQGWSSGLAPAAEGGRGWGREWSKLEQRLSCMHSLCIASCPPAVTQALPCSGQQSLVLPLFFKQEVLAPSAQASPLAPMTVRAWQSESPMYLSPQRGWDLAKVASDKGRETSGCEWGVWFWEQPCHIFTHNEMYFGAVNWFFCKFLEPYHLSFTQGLWKALNESFRFLIVLFTPWQYMWFHCP